MTVIAAEVKDTKEYESITVLFLKQNESIKVVFLKKISILD